MWIKVWLLVCLTQTIFSDTWNDRPKRSVWLDDTEDGPKYSWFCRECDMQIILHVENNQPVTLCTKEAEKNGEPNRNLRWCTFKERCEILSQAEDKNEKPVWPELLETAMRGPVRDIFLTPAGFVNILDHRYCCDKHDICDLRISDDVKNMMCNPTNVTNEYARRTCCQLGGLLCDFDLPDVTEEETNACRRANCPNGETGIFSCCLTSNATCEIAKNSECPNGYSCDPSPRFAGAEHCLYPRNYEFCCEFLNICDVETCNV